MRSAWNASNERVGWMCSKSSRCSSPVRGTRYATVGSMPKRSRTSRVRASSHSPERLERRTRSGRESLIACRMSWTRASPILATSSNASTTRVAIPCEGRTTLARTRLPPSRVATLSSSPVFPAPGSARTMASPGAAKSSTSGIVMSPMRRVRGIWNSVEMTVTCQMLTWHMPICNGRSYQAQRTPASSA